MPKKETAPKKESPKTVATKKKVASKAGKKAEDTKKESLHTKFSGKYTYVCGKRKNAIARVRLYHSGKNEIIVNNKTTSEYFKIPYLLGLIKLPFKLTDHKEYSITAKIVGGGISAQAEALRHGISKALAEMDENYRAVLKPSGYLTRDSRIVERKKPGRKKARKAQQWVKR